MRRVFKDNVLQQYFDENGYVVVPFLNEDEINSVNRIYKEMVANDLDDKGFYISIMSDNQEYKNHINREIRQIVRPNIDKYLDDYKFITSNFAVKKDGEGSEFDLHQGITFTDESKYTSITAWVPMVDVDESNGCLQIIRGSHRFFDQPFRKTPHFQHPFREIKPFLWEKYTEPVFMKAGEAFIFHHRLIHGSKPNTSGDLRLAILNVLTPGESPVWLCTSKNEDPENLVLELYQFDRDNYNQQDVLRKPDFLDGVNCIDTVMEDETNVSEEEFSSIHDKFRV